MSKKSVMISDALMIAYVICSFFEGERRWICGRAFGEKNEKNEKQSRSFRIVSV